MANLLGSALGGVGTILGGIGTQQAGEQQRDSLNAAMGQLKQGYGQAQGIQQPIYDTGVGNYQTLSGQNASGNFSMPKATPFDGGQFNFQADPGYQFTKGQGEDQINNRAAMGGMGHSPQTTKALMSYDTGLANQTYQAAFDRFNTNRNFSEGASNTAFNQNFQNNNAAFGRGMSLANPGFSAANQMGQNAIGLGTALGGIEEQKGGINGQLAANPFSVGQGLIGQGQQLIPGMQNQQMVPGGQGGMAQQPGMDPNYLASLMGMIGGG